MMDHHVLILGGTTEARHLAERLAGLGRVTLSLAGRTKRPARQPVPVRGGGFGGAEGLATFLSNNDVTVLADATHPFAARISANAAIAAEAAGVPLVRLERPAWSPVAGDRWIEADSVAEAVAALGSSPRRVFAALGRQELAPLEVAPGHFYLVRSVDPVEPPLDLPHVEYLLARGPFAMADELALLERHRIDAILCKNSGGAATYAKIEAARQLGIDVLMVRRPTMPAAGVVASTVEQAFEAIAHAMALVSERGE